MKTNALFLLSMIAALVMFSAIFSCGDDDDDDGAGSEYCWCYCAGDGCTVTGLNNENITTLPECEEWCESACLSKGCPLENAFLADPSDATIAPAD